MTKKKDTEYSHLPMSDLEKVITRLHEMIQFIGGAVFRVRMVTEVDPNERRVEECHLNEAEERLSEAHAALAAMYRQRQER